MVPPPRARAASGPRSRPAGTAASVAPAASATSAFPAAAARGSGSASSSTSAGAARQQRPAASEDCAAEKRAASAAAPKQQALQQREDSFEWLRTANDPGSRRLRLAAARETRETVSRGWYWCSDERVPLASAELAEAGTRILAPSAGVWPALPAPRRGRPPVTCRRAASGTVPAVATALARGGRSVAAVSAGSAFQVGGGFSTGGRHALEEALCVQSSLFRCLESAWRHAGAAAGSPYIPADGCVLSPKVEVFRDGTSAGYAVLPRPVELTCVVTMAMPNLNPCVRDTPLDTFSDPAAYHGALRKKWRAALHAACVAGATDVVCPDAGCGVYQNEPSAVGAALAEVLRAEFAGHFEALWLVGSDAFCAAVGAAAPAEARATATGLGADAAEEESPSGPAPLSELNLRRWLQGFRGGSSESARKKPGSKRSAQSTTISEASSYRSDTETTSGTLGGSTLAGDTTEWARQPSSASSIAAAAAERRTGLVAMCEEVTEEVLEELPCTRAPLGCATLVGGDAEGAASAATSGHSAATAQAAPEARWPAASGPPSSFNEMPGADLAPTRGGCAGTRAEEAEAEEAAGLRLADVCAPLLGLEKAPEVPGAGAAQLPGASLRGLHVRCVHL